MVGRVRWFDPQKHYGFLVAGNGEADVFVHEADVEVGPLTQGDWVEYEVGHDVQGRPKAVAVKLMGGKADEDQKRDTYRG